MTATRDMADTLVTEAAVVGGGVAGLATAIQLARKGTQVTLIEHQPWPRPAIGESLEFSAPRLLTDLGVDLAQAREAHQLYPKTSVRIIGRTDEFVLWPPRWFALPPIWCSRETMHADRIALDHHMLELAIGHGVEVLPERVTAVDRDGTTITGLRTDGGRRVEANLYVDASGATCRLFGRALQLEREELGQPRIGYWARLPEAPRDHATCLYFPEAARDELAWGWEIPLNSTEVSIGTVMPVAHAQAARRQGQGAREIFAGQVASIHRLRDCLARHPDATVHTSAYTPYRHRQTCGPNWFLVGDASGMVDPLTSNGVTSALRHAELVAHYAGPAIGRAGLTLHQQRCYERAAPAAITTLNRAIDTFLYRPGVRHRLGLRAAVNLYGATGVVTNALYAKTDPAASIRRSWACAAMLAMSRLWVRAAAAVLCRTTRRRGRHRPEPTPAPMGAG